MSSRWRTASEQNRALRAEVRELYESYFDCLDEQDIEGWTTFFHEQSSYQVQSFDNYSSGYRICDIFCDSHSMIKDRAQALCSSAKFEARHVRRFLGSFCANRADSALIDARSSYLAIETLANEPPQLFSAGKSFDRLIRVDGHLLFQHRTVIYDQTFIRNTLVFPL